MRAMATQATERLVEWRNTYDNFMFPRCLVAEVGFAYLHVISLVETAASSVFCLLAMSCHGYFEYPPIAPFWDHLSSSAITAAWTASLLYYNMRHESLTAHQDIMMEIVTETPIQENGLTIELMSEIKSDLEPNTRGLVDDLTPEGLNFIARKIIFIYGLGSRRFDAIPAELLKEDGVKKVRALRQYPINERLRQKIAGAFLNIATLDTMDETFREERPDLRKLLLVPPEQGRESMFRYTRTHMEIDRRESQNIRG